MQNLQGEDNMTAENNRPLCNIQFQKLVNLLIRDQETIFLEKIRGVQSRDKVN